MSALCRGEGGGRGGGVRALCCVRGEGDVCMAPRARRDESPRKGNIRSPRCCPCFHLAGDSGVNLIFWDLRLTCLLAHRELELVRDVRWQQRHLGSRIPYPCLTGVDALLAGVATRRKCITSNRRTRQCTLVSSIVNSWATRGLPFYRSCFRGPGLQDSSGNVIRQFSGLKQLAFM